MGYLTLAFAFFIGLVIDRIWVSGALPDKKIDKIKGLQFVSWLEHYHWFLLLTVLYSLFSASIFHRLEFLAFGVALLIGEHIQTHPYAIKSNHFRESTAIAVILLILLMVSTWLL